MNDDRNEFAMLAVQLFFKRYHEGRVVLNDPRVPNLMQAIQAVKFDADGIPDMETVLPVLRAAAIAISGKEIQQFEQAVEKTGDHLDPVGMLPNEVDTSEDVLVRCQSEADFDILALELFKETGCVASVASLSYSAELPTKLPWERNQAVCGGLLVRIVKYEVLPNVETVLWVI